MTGFASKRMMVAGRQHGKSWSAAEYWNQVHYSPVQDLVINSGTVYGSRYHTVQPVGGNWREMESWCQDTFGYAGDKLWGEKTAPEPAHRWYMNNSKFWFREERDLTMFILRWR